jgi:hypothetical protein
MRRNLFHIYLIVFFFAWTCMSQLAHASLIYPGDPRWTLSTLGAGNASIPGSIPRSGNASLALKTTGSLEDWAFYNRYAGNGQPGSSSWGLLSDVNRLSFDWLRQSIDNTWDDLPWRAQTPALRLYVSDPLNTTHMLSELVWEKFYTDSSTAVTNLWVTQSILGVQNLWRHVLGDGLGTGYTVVGGETKNPFYPDPLLTLTISSWSELTSIYSAAAVVYGIGVGVGSYWPDRYVGYVDNVLLDFVGSAGPVVNDNFELPVPEPSSLALALCGLAFLVAGGFIHRRRES